MIDQRRVAEGPNLDYYKTVRNFTTDGVRNEKKAVFRQLNRFRDFKHVWNILRNTGLVENIKKSRSSC